MKALIDTNILLDVFRENKDFFDASYNVLILCDNKILDGRISTLTIANSVYYLKKVYNKDECNSIIFKLGAFLKFEDFKSKHVFDAINLDFNDFEDALQTATAIDINADYIITRNKKDFKKSPIKVVTPEEMLTILSE